MTKLHWVRHGPTHSKTLTGWTDVAADLSDSARIARLTAHLPDTALLVSSDLIRAVTTADVLQTANRIRQPHHPDLRELHFGAWENRSAAEVSVEDPDTTRAFWETPGDVCPPGGESWDMMAARVCAVADALARAGRDAIVVAHFGAILSQVQRARGCTPQEAFSQPLEPLSVTRLRWDGRAWHEELVNHIP